MDNKIRNDEWIRGRRTRKTIIQCTIFECSSQETIVITFINPELLLLYIIIISLYLTLLSESAVHNHHQFYCVNKKSPPKLYNALAVNNNTATRVDHVHYSLSFSGLPHLIITTTQCVACLLQVSHFSRSHSFPVFPPPFHTRPEVCNIDNKMCGGDNANDCTLCTFADNIQPRQAAMRCQVG